MYSKFDMIDARPITLRELRRLGVQEMTLRDLLYDLDPIPFFGCDADEGTIDI